MEENEALRHHNSSISTERKNVSNGKRGERPIGCLRVEHNRDMASFLYTSVKVISTANRGCRFWPIQENNKIKILQSFH